MYIARSFQAIAVGVVALALQWTPVSAAVIYDNNGTVDDAILSDADDSFFEADDFVLQFGASTVIDVHWTGVYAFTDTPGTDNFTIQFYTDVGGSPSTVAFATFPVGSAVNRTDTGIDISGLDLYSYSADIPPLVLPPNTAFWISIFNDTTSDIDDDWFWGASGFGGNVHFRLDMTSPWIREGVLFDHDFQLTGPNGVPEPMSLALLGIGLAGLALTRRKRVAN